MDRCPSSGEIVWYRSQKVKVGCSFAGTQQHEIEIDGKLKIVERSELTPLSESMTLQDNINPSYYKGDTVMVFIEQFSLSFCLGNAVKYIARHQSKNRLEDLKKAQWYLNREIARLERT